MCNSSVMFDAFDEYFDCSNVFVSFNNLSGFGHHFAPCFKIQQWKFQMLTTQVLTVKSTVTMYLSIYFSNFDENIVTLSVNLQRPIFFRLLSGCHQAVHHGCRFVCGARTSTFQLDSVGHSTISSSNLLVA